jgi:glycosyltransferase involved in cell wall biosynthesis
MAAFDVTAIINLHAEGALAHASLKSHFRARAFAEASGLRVESLAVLDKPTRDTLEVLAHFSSTGIRSLTVEHGDSGQARNSGVETAQGAWVSFLDGDDLWGENWLVAAYNAANKDSRSIVWHPTANIYFGTQRYLFAHVDMEDDDFDPVNLSFNNYWTALSFAKRELFLSLPYPASDLKGQVGYEDWNWNLETISRGYLHKCVPGTVHAIRARQHSVSQETVKHKGLPAPTTLFREMIGRRPPSW